MAWENGPPSDTAESPGASNLGKLPEGAVKIPHR
jgi:hypothetical protein